MSEAAKPHGDYPLEITKDEQRLGFERWEVYRLVDPDFYSIWTPAVCKVLSESEIVLKITGLFGGVAYSHRRYGWMLQVRKSPPDWNPVGSPYATCEQAVFEAEIGASEARGVRVVAAPAELRKPTDGC